MRRRILKWWYARRLRKAFLILTDNYNRHKDAGHEVYLRREDEDNTVSISFYCVHCVELQPLRRKPEDVEHITVGSDGRPYRG